MSGKKDEVMNSEVVQKMREIVDIAENVPLQEIFETIEKNIAALSMKLSAYHASADLLEKFIQEKGMWNEYTALFKIEQEKIINKQNEVLGG